ncbi:MAG: hypothetical protein QM296_02580, partial [Bacillota bacterium]|nr:hypothetical protein [Bacillota bacterium]
WRSKLPFHATLTLRAVQRRARLLCGQDEPQYKILFVKLSILTRIVPPVVRMRRNTKFSL